VIAQIVTPQTTYTGKWLFSAEDVRRLRDHLHAQDLRLQMHVVMRELIQSPEDITVQWRLNQLASLSRLFGEHNRMGLDELWQHETLAPQSIRLILSEMCKIPEDDPFLVDIINLLCAKIVGRSPGGQEGMRSHA